MKRMLTALVLGLFSVPIVAQTVSPAVAPPKAGTYEVVNYSAKGPGTVLGLVKLTPKGGAIDAELVTAAPKQRGLTLKSAAMDGPNLHMTFQRANADLIFEGQVPRVDADTVHGTIVSDGTLTPAKLAFTDKTELTASNATAPATELTPLRDALNELRKAGGTKAGTDRVSGWVNDIFKAAQPFGPRYEQEMLVQVTEILAAQGNSSDLAEQFLQRAERAANAGGSPEMRYRVTNALATSQRIAGHDTDAEATEARVGKLLAEMDREYLATVPPFKPTAYEGRKEHSDRVAVMELFTGAQCPPCVASDVAFDALEKTYKPAEVILLQYHQHIPGADPMTNPATEARWNYYRGHFRNLVTGTPTVVFNGQPQRSGGGPMGASENLYNRYRGILDKLLEEQSKTAVSLDAHRQGDTVTLRADVSNLPEPGEDKKLRFVLAEESVRFVGSNKLRYHHMVVRAMPGGPQGVALTEKEGKHTASVNLAELRKELVNYLDDYAVHGPRAPFPQPQRPLAMANLKAIALVQDDKTQEILQAVIVDVGGTHAGQ